MTLGKQIWYIVGCEAQHRLPDHWILSHLQTAEATERAHRSVTCLADVKESRTLFWWQLLKKKKKKGRGHFTKHFLLDLQRVMVCKEDASNCLTGVQVEIFRYKNWCIYWHINRCWCNNLEYTILSKVEARLFPWTQLLHRSFHTSAKPQRPQSDWINSADSGVVWANTFFFSFRP